MRTGAGDADPRAFRERYPTVDLAAWLDARPWQDKDMVDRWRADLISAGAIV